MASAVWLAWTRLPPILAGYLERALAARGFPDARVRVSSLGLHHVTLTGVTLGPGLALGTVELDAGISLLWSPRVHQLTVRGSRLSQEAIARLAQRRGGGGGAWPFEVVRVVDGEVTLAGVPVAVSGTARRIGSNVALELDATAARIALGPAVPFVVEAPHATVRGTGRALRACVTGRVTELAVEACATLPATLRELVALRAVEATVRAKTPRWGLRGQGTLDWTSGLALRAGQVDVRAPALALGDVTLRGARISAALSGNLAERALELRGEARADRLELRTRATSTEAAGVHVPLAARIAYVHGAVQVTPSRALVVTARRATVRCADTAIEVADPQLTALAARRPIVIDPKRGPALPRRLAWSARRARIGAAQLQAPSGTLAPGRTLRWRATEATWRGARFRAPSGVVGLEGEQLHTGRWAAIAGPGPLELGTGELGVHCRHGRWRLAYGRVRALGGELAIEPAIATAAGKPRAIELVVRVRALALHRLLAAFARGRADGTGMVDGELALRIDRDGLAIRRAALRARPGGGLRLSDASWRARATAAASGSAVGLALHQRIAATLSDFTYARLALVLHPEGTEPELQISTQGRGKRIAQDIDLLINLRGVRNAARMFSSVQPTRSQE